MFGSSKMLPGKRVLLLFVQGEKGSESNGYTTRVHHDSEQKMLHTSSHRMQQIETRIGVTHVGQI